VSFALDGAPEVVIPGRTGFLVEANDSKGLAGAISTLVADPEMRKRYGAEGRRVVDPAFRAETMVSEISRVYERLIEKHQKRLRKFDDKAPARRAGYNQTITSP
jgi:glycosyltransferase involved in cell wall biosynthesis